jgi:hypothetical protein
MTIKQLVKGHVDNMTSNSASYTFLHSETQFQNLMADEQLLPCVYLDMPMKYTPKIAITGAFQETYICVALFLFKSELDDNDTQQESTFIKAKTAQREFQIALENDVDNVRELKVETCVQVLNLFDTNMSGVMMPFSLRIINTDGVC